MVLVWAFWGFLSQGLDWPTSSLCGQDGGRTLPSCLWLPHIDMTGRNHHVWPGFLFCFVFKKHSLRLDMVAHACDLSYAADGDGKFTMWGQCRQKLVRPGVQVYNPSCTGDEGMIAVPGKSVKMISKSKLKSEKGRRHSSKWYSICLASTRPEFKS